MYYNRYKLLAAEGLIDYNKTNDCYTLNAEGLKAIAMGGYEIWKGSRQQYSNLGFSGNTIGNGFSGNTIIFANNSKISNELPQDEMISTLLELIKNNQKIDEIYKAKVIEMFDTLENLKKETKSIPNIFERLVSISSGLVTILQPLITRS